MYSPAAAAAAPAAWTAQASKLRARYGRHAPAVTAANEATADAAAATAATDPELAALKAALKQAIAGPDAGASSVGGGYASGASANNLGCDFCNTAVEYVKIALRNNQTVEEIEEVREGGVKGEGS